MRSSLISMLKQLMEDMVVLNQQGAGYYSCIPIIQRYNKLLGQSRKLYPADDSLMNTFEVAEEEDPKDPAEKMKIVQAVRIEAGQLISLLESSEAEETPSTEEDAS